MPKMSLTPAASREVTRLCAPVICSVMGTVLSWGRGSGRARRGGSRATKNPSAAGATRGDASADWCSAGAPHAYEEVDLHAATVAGGLRSRHPESYASHHA